MVGHRTECHWLPVVAYHTDVQLIAGGPLATLFAGDEFLPHPRGKVSIVGSLRDREVACSASDRQGSNFESCVWRTVSSQSSHHPQEVLLAQFSLYVHKGGLKPDSFHFLGMRIFNFVNFESLIYMKLYNLLILNKIQKYKKKMVSH